MAQGYQLISKGRADGCTTCEHCGRVILNFAIIRGRDTNRDYRVGLDCMETLCSIGRPEAKEMSINF